MNLKNYTSAAPPEDPTPGEEQGHAKPKRKGKKGGKVVTYPEGKEE